MAGEKFFTVLAGTSENHFSIGGVDFQAAPLTLAEYGKFLAVPDDISEQAHFLADKLKRRVRGTKHNPDDITPEWLMDNLTIAMMATLKHVLLYGEMPEAVGGAGKR